MRIMSLIFLSFFILSCQRPSNHNDSKVNKNIQNIRSEIIYDFFKDSDSSIIKYKDLLNKNSSSIQKQQISENLAAISQLIRRDKDNRDRYFLYIKRQMNNEDDEIQSLAVAALSGDSKIETLNILFEKLKNGPEIVKIEALSALKYRYDDIYADKSQREAINLAKNKAVEFCNSNKLSKSIFPLEFCKYFKNRDSLSI